MTSTPQSTFYSAFQSAISHERLAPFRLPGDSDEQVLCRYFWSIALNDALYQPLQVLEVVLRNSLHRTIANTTTGLHWIYAAHSILQPPEQAAVNEVLQDLRRSRIPATHHAVIPRLSFGFWTSLLNSRYEPLLWPRLLRSAFPHVPRRARTRKTLSTRLNGIRNLRNRVFHHEPVWHWPDLQRQHQNLIEAIGWISPVAKAAAQHFDRFSAIHQSGLTPYLGTVSALCQLQL